MAKYDPLHVYLRRQSVPETELTFRQIENLIGRMHPRSTEQPARWSGETADPARAVQFKVWRQAGNEASLVVGAVRVKFFGP